MEVKRVLIPKAGERDTLVRRLGHAVLLQWESLSVETRRLLSEQASLIELLGAAQGEGDELDFSHDEPRSWRGTRPPPLDP
jgi:hypothetical protein